MKFKLDFKDSKTMAFFIGTAIILIILNVLFGIDLNRFIIISLALFLSFALLNHIYEKNAAQKLKFEIMDREIRKFKNQEGVLRIRITQDGMLPVLDGMLSLSAGDDIVFHEDVSTGLKNHTETAVTFTVMPKSSVIIEVPFTARARGLSKILNAQIRIPRIFGFGTLVLSQTGRTNHEIIIYPDRLAVHNEEMKNQINQGVFAKKNTLFNDPLLTMGTKDYHPHDNIRDIHWKATARTGRFQTRLYEKTTRISWLILVNLRSERNYAPPGNIEEIFEKLAFITGKAAEENIPYRIITNMVTFDSNAFFKLDESTGRPHYRRTLEALARINTVTYTLSFERLLRHARLHEEMPTHVIFTGVADAPITEELLVFKVKGADVFQLNTHGITPFEAVGDKGVTR